MHAFLLSLRMRMIREHAHIKKSLINIKRHSWKEAWILWFLLCPSHVQMHTPFVVDPHWMFVCNFMTGLHQFMSKQFAPRTYERSIYERTFLSEPIKNLKNHAISTEVSNVNLVKKHLHKRYRVYRRDRELSRTPKRTLERLRKS